MTTDTADHQPHPRHDPRVRVLPVPGSHNIRDIGGIPLTAGGVVECGRVLRGEAPALLGHAGVAALYDYGVRHVIDLRSDRERAAEGHGALQRLIDDGRVALHAVPLVSDAGWDTDPVGKDEPRQDGQDVAAHYLAGLDRGGPLLAAALQAALADAPSAVYVHCAVGKDRTGVVIATLLDALGADPAAIVDDYVLTGELFRPIVAQLGRSATYARDLRHPNWAAITPRAAAMKATLAILAGAGGGRGWLARHGVSEGTVRSWAHQLSHRPAGDQLH